MDITEQSLFELLRQEGVVTPKKRPNRAAIYRNPRTVNHLAQLIADRVIKTMSSGDNVDLIVGPDGYGLNLASFVAFNIFLTTGREVLTATTRRSLTQPGYTVEEADRLLISHRKVFVVDDFVTTGDSAGMLIEEISERKGQVVGFGAIMNLGDGAVKGKILALAPQVDFLIGGAPYLL